MVRISFFISLALAAQGIAAAPAGTSVRNQTELGGYPAETSSSVPDRITGFPGGKPAPAVPERTKQEEEEFQNGLDKEFKENKQK
ncbi:uncharacterized protein G6M90_00g066790 [Metarhizium brunneum]|uniref:Uncharacterized protein n=1 Tax=Metarhizium brunneum TaxID=500148 RepID=A0A7D5Z7W3_9HYPO